MTLFASCEKRKISKNMRKRVTCLCLSSILVFKINFLAKNLHFTSKDFCEKQRRHLKSEKLKNVQLGDKCGRQITPGRGIRSLQTYRHYPPFFGSTGCPAQRRLLLLPRKATFNSIPPFFNPIHGNLPVIIPCAFPFLDGVSRQD